MFKEPEGTKVFGTDVLATTMNNADEMNIYVQKGNGAKKTSGPLSSANPRISAAAQKTTFIQHGLKIYIFNQNTLLCIQI